MKTTKPAPRRFPARVNVLLEAETLASVATLAKREGRSTGGMLRELVKRGLEVRASLTDYQERPTTP